jgi:hypothetical protein
MKEQRVKKQFQFNRARSLLLHMSANARARVRQPFALRQYSPAMRSFYGCAISSHKKLPTHWPLSPCHATS